MGNVIKIDEFHFSRKSRKDKRCSHRKFIFDDHGQTIHCHDCGDQLSSYWVLEEVTEAYMKKMSELKREHEIISKIRADLEKEHTFLRVLKKVHDAWRRPKKMAVCCPHCKEGIMPEDGLGNLQVNPKFKNF